MSECKAFIIWVQVITIGRERYTVGEALFKPSILGLEADGIIEQLVECISTVSSENHRQLLENTVLCGGTASMMGELTFFGSTFISRYIFVTIIHFVGLMFYHAFTPSSYWAERTNLMGSSDNFWLKDSYSYKLCLER